jgi:mannose-6-phosphate isomerase-like protein (cupin superfamily)
MKLSSLAHLPEEQVSHNPEIRKQVMLRSGDLPHLTNFSQARFAPGQISAAHAHQDMYEVFFVEAGIGTIAINGTLYPLTVGTCVAVEATEIHEIINTGNSELVLTYFGLRVESSDHA